MALSDSLYLGLTAVLLVASIVGLALLGPGSGGAVRDEPAGVRTDLTGERYTVPADRLYPLCPGECIPPVIDPRYERAANVTWLDQSDTVIGVSIDGRTFAYPLSILQYHGVVNDRIGGTPLAITYSPHSEVSRAFVRRVADGSTMFRHAGGLYNGDMVMRDAATGSSWSQFTGAAIRGPAIPAELRTVDTRVVRWGLWREAHPDSRVLSRQTGIYNASAYTDDPYHRYRRSDRTPGVDPDDRMNPKTLVYGAAIDGAARAYPAVTVRDLGLVQDSLAGTPFMLVQDEREGTIHGFVRRVDGETLEFTHENGTLRDGSGTRWAISGRALTGPRRGATLPRLPLIRGYWFVWSAFHEDTGVFEAGG